MRRHKVQGIDESYRDKTDVLNAVLWRKSREIEVTWKDATSNPSYNANGERVFVAHIIPSSAIVNTNRYLMQ